MRQFIFVSVEWDEKLYDGEEPSEGYIFHAGMNAEDYGIDGESEDFEL
jgi:hypothetical protein